MEGQSMSARLRIRAILSFILVALAAAPQARACQAILNQSLNGTMLTVTATAAGGCATEIFLYMDGNVDNPIAHKYCPVSVCTVTWTAPTECLPSGTHNWSALAY